MLLAAKNYEDDIISFLISRGANINQQDKNGNTPIIISCLNCDDKSILNLHNRYADFFIKNNADQSAIDILIDSVDLPAELASLKEKILLEADSSSDSVITLSL